MLNCTDFYSRRFVMLGVQRHQFLNSSTVEIPGTPVTSLSDVAGGQKSVIFSHWSSTSTSTSTDSYLENSTRFVFSVQSSEGDVRWV
jgi:hypothetical protein